MPAHYTAQGIADYFLWKAQDEDQELLSNMKLQKLVYYAQGLHLVLNNVPLFKEKINAWTYGPVVPGLYHAYKHYNANGIPAAPNFKSQSIDEDVRELLDEIYDVFGQFSAIRLMEIAHSDQCWIDAGIGNEISHDAMRDCFRKYLNNG